MNYYQNPDYPTGVVNFMQFTEPNTCGNNTSFYYGGGGYVADSAPRRAANPFAQNQGYYSQPSYYPQSQQSTPQSSQYMSGSVADMLSMPEKNIQPYSSYGNTNTNMNGFNNYITEARRADAYNASQTGNNPWAQPAAPTPAQTVQPQNNGQVVNPFSPPAPQPYYYGYSSTGAELPGMYSTPGYQAYEQKVGVNVWDNMYGQPQQNYNINPMMSRPWPEAQNPQQRPVNYNFPQPTPAPFQTPVKFDAPELNWVSEANSNWGMK